MDRASDRTAALTHQRPLFDRSRYLPPIGVLAVILGVPLSCIPTRTLVLCDDAPEFPHYTSLYSTMWTYAAAVLVLSLISLITLLAKQQRTWLTVIRAALLLSVLSLVVLQDQVGEEATQVATRIFHSQTCAEPLHNVDAPKGVL